MVDWAALSQKMDGIVDKALHDPVFYNQGGGFQNVDAFVIYEVEPANLEELDDILGSRPRIKVRKTIVPEIKRSHRITSPLLGAFTFQPGNSDPETQGRYWIFDIQKV